MNSAKLKITRVVNNWEKQNPLIYASYKESRKLKTDNLANTFAETPGANFILRLLYELPEDLDFLIHRALDDAETEWFKTEQGGKWFAKSFKQYNVSQKT